MRGFEGFGFCGGWDDVLVFVEVRGGRVEGPSRSSEESEDERSEGGRRVG